MSKARDLKPKWVALAVKRSYFRVNPTVRAMLTEEGLV